MISYDGFFEWNVTHVKRERPHPRNTLSGRSVPQSLKMKIEEQHSQSLPSALGMGRSSSAWRMADDSEGKAIGSDDCYLMPVREGSVSGPIHRL
jgi:hypothetical protein